MKYIVKPNCTIYHANKQYNAGDILELTEEKALHHAANIAVYKPPEEDEDDEPS